MVGLAGEGAEHDHEFCEACTPERDLLCLHPQRMRRRGRRPSWRKFGGCVARPCTLVARRMHSSGAQSGSSSRKVVPQVEQRFFAECLEKEGAERAGLSESSVTRRGPLYRQEEVDDAAHAGALGSDGDHGGKQGVCADEQGRSCMLSAARPAALTTTWAPAKASARSR